MKNYRRVFLYVAALFVMALAGSQIAIPIGATTNPCCQYGSECHPQKCCAPGQNEADCSERRKYYCRASCAAVIVIEPVDPIEPGIEALP